MNTKKGENAAWIDPAIDCLTGAFNRSGFDMATASGRFADGDLSLWR